MFPELPADLSALSEEELTALLEAYAAAFEEARANASTTEDAAALNAAADNIAALRGEQDRRTEAAAAVQAEVEAAAARVAGALGTETPPEGEGGEGAEGTEGAEGELEPVTAGGTPAAPPAHHRRVPAIPARPQPNLADMAANRPGEMVPQGRASGLRILGGADLPGQAGTPLQIREVAEAMIDRQERLGRSSGSDGDVVQVAQVIAEAPTDRALVASASAAQNMEIIDPVVRALTYPDQHEGGLDALVAAGGLCAPVAPYYEMPVLAGAGRPVRDGLPSFNADRGGVTLIPPPGLGDLTSAITVVTAAQDVTGTTKACLHVACAAARTYTIDAIARCVEFGNFGARAFPEQVEAWLALAAAAHARRAETGLLDAIAANSLPATAPLALGASSEVFARAFQAAAAYRSRNRMDSDAFLSAMYPAWIVDMINADRVRAMEDSTILTRAQVQAMFREGGINASFYLDSKTGGGQVFGAQAVGFADAATTNASTTLTSATAAFTAADVGRRIEGAGIPLFTTIAAVTNGTTITLSQAATATAAGVTITIYGRSAALLTFPSSMVWYLFAPGTFVYLDGGELNFGLVRDSATNARNDYRIMVETFEKLAFFGLESLEITQTVCASGEIGARRTGGAALVCPV